MDIWKPTRFQVTATLEAVLTGVFVGIVALRYPVANVLMTGIIMASLALVGCVAFNVMGGLRRG